MCDSFGLNIEQNKGELTTLSDASWMPGRFLLYLELIVYKKKTHCWDGRREPGCIKPPSIDLFRQRSPSVGIVRNQGIGSVLWTSYLLMLGYAEVLRKDRILPFAFVSIDV